MALTKAELYEHKVLYDQHVEKARSAFQDHDLPDAIRWARKSWEFVNGMMQYEEKYQDIEFDSVEGLDLVIHAAPYVLDRESISELEALLKARRRISKNTATDELDSIQRARALLASSYRLWRYMESHPTMTSAELLRHAASSDEPWEVITECWLRIGLIRTVQKSGQSHFELTSRPDEVVKAKCSSCGALCRAPKILFLEVGKCPKCEKQAAFVLLANESSP